MYKTNLNIKCFNELALSIQAHKPFELTDNPIKAEVIPSVLLPNLAFSQCITGMDTATAKQTTDFTSDQILEPTGRCPPERAVIRAG